MAHTLLLATIFHILTTNYLTCTVSDSEIWINLDWLLHALLSQASQLSPASRLTSLTPDCLCLNFLTLCRTNCWSQTASISLSLPLPLSARCHSCAFPPVSACCHMSNLNEASCGTSVSFKRKCGTFDPISHWLLCLYVNPQPDHR